MLYYLYSEVGRRAVRRPRGVAGEAARDAAARGAAACSAGLECRRGQM